MCYDYGEGAEVMSKATVPANNDVIVVDPERLGGTPVFGGTRVPIKTLFDYLRTGDSIETFLDHFPGVHREQVEAVIDLAGRRLLSEYEFDSASVLVD